MRGCKPIIGVIGAGDATEYGKKQARIVGRLIAENGAVLVCGGLGGVMEAAAKGCHEAGGEVIGILPGTDAGQANIHVTIPIPTGMGHARNIIIAQTAHALIAIEGEYGTLSEIAIGRKIGKPVVRLGSWEQLDDIDCARTPEQAFDMISSALKETSPDEEK